MVHQKTIIFTLMLYLLTSLASCTVRPTDNDLITAQDIIARENATEWDLVVLGDSDMLLSYIYYEPLFEEDLGIPIVVHEETTPGTMTPVSALQQNEKLLSLISEAEIVVFNVPFAPYAGGACFDQTLSFAEADCFGISVEEYAQSTRDMIREIKKLVGAHGAMIRLQNTFMPIRFWEENRYLRDRSEKCVDCYLSYREAQAQVAESEGIPLVDVFALLNGPDGTQDLYELGYFFDSDPLHVNFEGAKAIAELYQSIGYEYWLP